MNLPGAVQVVLHLDPEAPIIHGWAEDVCGPSVEFYGWIELSALLDARRTRPGDGLLGEPMPQPSP
jgi:hypothetical protein